MSLIVCECGLGASSGDELADHLGEVFTPDDDLGTDAQVHAELSRPDADGSRWECLCGLVTIERAAFDAHLLAVFTPADGIGRDGQCHGRRDPGSSRHEPPLLLP